MLSVSFFAGQDWNVASFSLAQLVEFKFGPWKRRLKPIISQTLPWARSVYFPLDLKESSPKQNKIAFLFHFQRQENKKSKLFLRLTKTESDAPTLHPPAKPTASSSFEPSTLTKASAKPDSSTQASAVVKIERDFCTPQQFPAIPLPPLFSDCRQCSQASLLKSPSSKSWKLLR